VIFKWQVDNSESMIPILREAMAEEELKMARGGKKRKLI